MWGYGCTLVSLAVLFLSTCVAVQEEYCKNETFNATCADGEVIMMKSAMYGRMRLGRCLRQDVGSVGCSVDVLSHVDSLCSGKRTCDFVVPTDVMKQKNTCPEDQSSYLDISYNCVEGSGSTISMASFLLVAALGVVSYIIV